MPRLADIPREWPALMDLETAGHYLALAPGSLVGLLRREKVPPVDLGARIRRWRRKDLDDLVDRLPPAASVIGEAACAESKDGVDWALAAVERRAAAMRKAARRRPREIRQSHPAA
jgi:hypothetical protein